MKDKQFLGGLIALALIIAGVFCVTFTTLTQSIPLLLLIVAGILALVQSRKGVYRGNSGLKVMTLITVVYFLCRAYFSPVESLARQDMFLIAGGAMLYSIAGIFMPSKVVRSWITSAFILVMILNLLNWIPAVDQWRDSALGFAIGEKNTGWFNHRNFYGNFMFMMTCLCLSLALFSEEKSRVFRLGVGFLGVCGAVSVVFSTARASFLALALGGCVLLVCYIIVKSRAASKKQRSVFVMFGVGFMLVISIGLVIGSKFVLSERSTDMADSNGRSDYFALSIEQIPDAPLLGSGSRSVEYKSYEYWPMDMYNAMEDFRFVHNEYLQTVTDYGLIGLILLFAVFIWHVINGIVLLYAKSDKERPTHLAYVVAGLSIMIGLSVNLLFSFPMHGFVNLLLIVFASTMLLGESAEKRQAEIKPKLSFLLKPVSLLTLIGLMVYTGLEGSKEFMAGRAFWNQGIVADDLYWVQQEKTNDRWQLALTIALENSPSFFRYNRLGGIYLAKGELDEADVAYEKSKQMHPYSPISRISLARIDIRKGQYKAAEKEFKEVEYLVQNREPLFHYYQNLAEFFVGWSIVEPESRTELLIKAKQAYEISIKKRDGYINAGLRKTIAKTQLACYNDLLENEHFEESYQAFDEFVLTCRSIQMQTDEDAELFLSYARDMLKHADHAWNKGLMARSAKATHRANGHYYRYKNFKKGLVNQEWINEQEKINEALKMFQQAGIKIDKE